MQELKERLGMGARLESSLQGPNSACNEPISAGSRVHVLKGRRFEDFGSGDVGTIVELDMVAGTCTVAFDGLGQPRQVALRHLALEKGATRTSLEVTEDLVEDSTSSPSAAHRQRAPPSSPVATHVSPFREGESPAAQRVRSPWGTGHAVAQLGGPLKDRHLSSPARAMVPPLVLPAKEGAQHSDGPRSLQQLQVPNLSSPEPRAGSWQVEHRAAAAASHDIERMSPAPHASIPSPISRSSPSRAADCTEIWALRLQDLDGRLERLTQDTSAALNKLSSEIESFSEIRLWAKEAIDVSKRVDGLFSSTAKSIREDHSAALNKLTLEVESLTEVGKWANEAIVVGQHVSSQFTAVNNQVQEKGQVLDGLVSRIEKLEGQSSNLAASTSVQNWQQLHGCLDNNVKTLQQRVDALCEVSHRAGDVMKLGNELHEAIANHRGAAQERSDGPLAQPCSQAGRLLDASGTAAVTEALVEVDRLARDTESQVRRLTDQLNVQKEALSGHGAAVQANAQVFGEALANESRLREVAMAHIEEQCRQACATVENIAAIHAERSVEVDVPAIAQQFQAMLSDVRADIAKAETARKHDLEIALSSLRGELDASRHTPPGRERSPAQRVASSSPPRVATVLSVDSGRSASHTVTRISSAPVLPVSPATKATQGLQTQGASDVPTWPTSVRSQTTPVKRGPSRSSRHASPSGRQPCLQVRTLASAPFAPLSPAQSAGRMTSQQPGSTIMTTRVISPRLTSGGSAPTTCTLCGNLCMDDATTCRRCTLNSQRTTRTSSLVQRASPPQGAGAGTWVGIPRSSLPEWPSNAATTAAGACDSSCMRGMGGGSFSSPTGEDTRTPGGGELLHVSAGSSTCTHSGGLTIPTASPSLASQNDP